MSKIPCLSVGLPPTHPAIRSHPDVLSGKTTADGVKQAIAKMHSDLKSSRETGVPLSLICSVSWPGLPVDL